jgi:NADPH:quinone reductase-like Zn-dependent oxidoreductase
LQNGFSGTDLVLNDFKDDRCHEFSIILSTAIDTSQASVELPNVAIIFECASTKQQMLAEQLKMSLEAIGRVGRGGDSKVELWSINQAITTNPSSDTMHVFILELDRPVLYDMDKDMFNKVQRLLMSAKRILWVSQGSPKSRMVDGLARVVSSEDSRIAFTTLALDGAEHRINKQVEKIMQVLQATTSPLAEGPETEYVEQDGLLQINRLVEANYLNSKVHSKVLPQQTRIQNFGKGPPLRLSIASPGLLDTLQFLEDKEQSLPLSPSDVEVEVKAVGLNFRDILIALGRLNQTAMGGECAGVVTRVGEACTGIRPGDRVVVCYPDCYKSYVRVDRKCAIEIPDCLSFVEAATLPINYTTAWHALHEIARVQPGESVLIHSAAGGTGQAAIQVAQYLGANIFATVSTKSKKTLLMNLYNIPEEQIFYSRDTSFARGIQRLTRNHGVDVVLNSLSGEGLVASWESIAPFGRFLEIGKKDIYNHGKLPMFPFAKNVTFSAVDVAEMSVERTLLMAKALKAVISLVVAGKLHTAQPLQIYGISDIEKAFRYMQSGRTSGKIVFEMRKEDPVLVSEQDLEEHGLEPWD